MSRMRDRSLTRGMLQRSVCVLGLVACTGLSLAAGAASTPQPMATTPAATNTPARIVLVDINSAPRAQLKTLPGIGDAEADRIIAGRPYRSKADLVTKQALPAGVYQALRNHVIARQKPPGKA